MKRREPHVLQDRRTPYWVGVFYAWDRAGGMWKRVKRTTGCTSKAKAESVVREWDRLAREAAGDGESVLSRDRAMEAVNLILRLAGQPTLAPVKTWGEFSADWLRSQKVAEVTMRGLVSTVNTFTASLGRGAASRELSSIQGADVQKWLDDLVKDGLAPSSANTRRTVLKRIFERAREEGHGTRNPVALVPAVSSRAFRPTREVFTKVEVAGLIKYLLARQSDPEMQDWLTMCYLGLCTGRRIMDCATAGWQSITEADGMMVWELRPMKLRHKGKVERIPIVPPLLGHLQAVRKRATTLWLCPTLAEVSAGGGAGLSARFIALLKEAGIEVPVIERSGPRGHDYSLKGFHSWRHTLTTMLAESGVEERLSMRVVGHASKRIHAGYTHTELGTMEAALKRALGV